jgi:hypothetical protein
MFHDGECYAFGHPMKAKRPELLKFGMYGSGILGFFLLFGLLCEVAGLGSYSINEEPVSAQEFLHQVGIFQALIALNLVAVCLTLAANVEWSRGLMLVFWITTGGCAAGFLREETDSFLAVLLTAAPFLLPLALAAWYLYWNEEAVAYYNAMDTTGAV